MEGRNAVHMNLDRLLNLMEFIKAKCKVLHLGLGNSEYKPSGQRWVESNLEEKELGLFADNNLNMTWQCALTSQL